MSALTSLASLVSAALVLMIFSFLYRHNKWFAFASAIYIGGASGQYAAISLNRVYTQGVVPMLSGSPWYIISLILGALLFTRFFPKYSWWIRIPTGILLGTGIGLNMAAGVKAQILAQVLDTMRPLNTGSMLSNINNLIIIVGVSCVTLYFFFSGEVKGVMKPINKTGRYFLMIGFGSAFAYALLGRTSLLIERFKDLLVAPGYYLIPVAVAIIAYDALKRRNSV